MAEEKKRGDSKDKKSSGNSSKSESSGDHFLTDVLFWVLFVLVLWYVLGNLGSFFGFNSFSFPRLTSIFSAIFGGVQVFSIFLCLVFVLGIIYTKFKIRQLRHHDINHGYDAYAGAHSGHSPHPNKGYENAATHASNKRWESILHRIESPNESDWRLAIIECDILLNEMLSKMGYHGESVADKLKRVEKSDFHTIEEAWEAHKTRNRIAHSGSEYHLSKSEAEKTFNQYKKVFDEFYFI